MEALSLDSSASQPGGFDTGASTNLSKTKWGLLVNFSCVLVSLGFILFIFCLVLVSFKLIDDCCIPGIPNCGVSFKYFGG